MKLAEHYNPDQQRQLAEAELDRRRQRQDEPLRDYATDILRLARLAYPAWPEAKLQTTARKAFVAGIANGEVRRQLRLRRPASFTEALTDALHIDAVEEQEQPPGKRPRLCQVSQVASTTLSVGGDVAGPSGAAGPSAGGPEGDASGSGHPTADVQRVVSQPADATAQQLKDLVDQLARLAKSLERPVTWEVRGSLDGKPCQFTFDPGAAVTIVKTGFVKTGNTTLRPSALHARGAFDAPNASSALLGPRSAVVSLGGPALTVHVFEGAITSSCLLGADFVAAHDTLVLRDGQSVRMTRTTTPIPDTSVSVRVVAAQRVVVGAGDVVGVAVSVSLFVNTSSDDWDLQVPLVMLSLRVAPHSTNGMSPAMMLLGRELDLPPSLARGRADQHPDLATRLAYPIWLRDRLHDLHDDVRERALTASLRAKERYDLRAKRPALAEQGRRLVL
ncbi:UPF0291 protein GK1331 [Frankliniella fusca]|uniref:UPF0291 protein GK1331 n=1 Tax=Frankliniella fusca TaxID=407009 RepID=A0AAE1HN15_9NEOP|nr:UPF0291 protein GK1331 [Frankliniella fusca]